MPSSLTLGPILFSDFEIPERFTIGGKQHLVVHSLPGGGRVVDAMGPDDAPVRWSGVFSGQLAAERVRMLERLRRSGAPQLLSWAAWRYTVVVQDFQADITSTWWIPYRIQLCVLSERDSQTSDWLNSAAQPALTVGLLSAALLESAISTAGLGLASSNVGIAITSAGDLARIIQQGRRAWYMPLI